MSATSELLILGLVRWLQPVHGYDVRRELMSWQVDQWAGIKPGSIYHGLRRMNKRGYLEVVATERVEKRPERTSYRITSHGEAQFQQLLRRQLWTLEPVYDPFFGAWSFLPVLPAREAAAMLRNRAAMLDDRIGFYAHNVEASQQDDPSQPNFMPRHVLASLELGKRTLEVHKDWCLENAELIEAGELYQESIQIPQETAKAWKHHIDTLDSAGRKPGEPDSTREEDEASSLVDDG